jgi:uncharacterized protein (TIGR02118 family)
MITISIMYPYAKGARFDVSYYVNTHMPMSIKLASAHPGFKGVSVERGVAGVMPGSDPAYVMMTHFTFTSVEDFWAATKPNAETLQNDMSNYTDIQPVMQFNEVLISE